jgi:hypothetical protein
MGLILGVGSALADVAVQYHCAGASQLAGNNHLTNLQKVFSLRSTTNLEDIALAKFSRSVTNSLQLAKYPMSAALIEPLLCDVVKTESLGSFGGVSDKALSFILALHLETPREQLWEDNFTKIFGGGGDKMTSQGFSGLRWNTGGSNFLWMIPAQNWLVVGCGDDFSAVEAEYLNQIKAQGRPVAALKNNWLEADLSTTGLGGWFRVLKPAHITITVAPNEEDWSISARVLEAEAVSWNSVPMQMPENFMRGRIISFTTGQNVAAFLNVNPTLAHLAGEPLTNQFYFWALDQMPFLNFMGWPVENASNAMQTLSTEAPAVLNPELKRFNGTQLVWHPEAGVMVLQNIRLLTPVLQPIQDTNGQFLLLTSYRASTNGQPAPPELLGQIQDRTNLVYYDWELTGRRLQEWQILRKMIANRSEPQNRDTVAATLTEMQWMTGVAGFLDSTVTEVTRIAPNELSIKRKAPLGFTAVELVLLADWLCNANSGPIR